MNRENDIYDIDNMRKKFKEVPMRLILDDSFHNKYFEKIFSNTQEVIARGGKVLLVTDKNDLTINENIRFKLQVPFIEETLSPFILTIPLQLLAYHVALLKNCDVDKPRNLAKSVTVE